MKRPIAWLIQVMLCPIVSCDPISSQTITAQISDFLPIIKQHNSRMLKKIQKRVKPKSMTFISHGAWWSSTTTGGEILAAVRLIYQLISNTTRQSKAGRRDKHLIQWIVNSKTHPLSNCSVATARVISFSLQEYLAVISNLNSTDLYYIPGLWAIT